MTLMDHDVRAAMFSPSASDGAVAIFTLVRGISVLGRFLSFEGDILDYETLRSGITHDGEEYTHAVVSYGRPDDIPGRAAEISLVLENVDQDLGDIAKVSVNDLVVTLKHISIVDPETIIEEFPDFRVLSCGADVDSSTVAMQLTTDPIENEPANMLKFTPDQFGGLFP